MIYLASISTDNYEIENRAYKSIGNALEYIYDSLKALAKDIIDDEKCFDFFDRDYIKSYLSEEFFNQFNKVWSRTEFGEFIIERPKINKYRFLFDPNFKVLKSTQPHYIFIVCELEILELLD